MIIKKMNKNKKGFSLIELILVLGLSSLAFLALIQWEMKKSEIVRAEIGGEQMLEVSKALTAYIAREQDALSQTAGTVQIPLKRLQGTNSDGVSIYTTGLNCYPGNGATAPTATTICGRPYLPTTFSANNVLGFGYDIFIKNNNGRLEGLVLSSIPVCEKGANLACPSANNSVKYDWAGSAINKMGAQGGMVSFVSSTTLAGYNGGWQLTSADYTNINASGKLGVRVGLTDTSLYDSQYLRLDGTSIMRGNLNIGQWDINNATNITYTGWLKGFGVLANTINSGSINNTGDIQTRGLFATTIVKAGNVLTTVPTGNLGNIPTVGGSIYTAGIGQIQADNSIVANNSVIAMHSVSTRDIFLGNSDARVATGGGGQTRSMRTIPNVWLSDLLPKYSSRGIYRVNSGSPILKPACGTGTPKIEVIPQLAYVQGRVWGNNNIVAVGGGLNWGGAGIYNDWNLKSYGAMLAWADDLGAIWRVNIQTTQYSQIDPIPGFAGTANPPGVGLIHVYCDFNF